MDMKWIKE